MHTLDHITKTTGPNPNYSVIWLHGLGADGHDFASIVSLIELPENVQVRFVFPHAPMMPVTLNAGMHMRAWFDIYGLDFYGDIDEPGIKQAAQHLIHFIEKEHAAGIAYENIILAGFSQGGAVALYTGLRFKEKLGGILGLSTFLPLSERLEKEASEANKTIPIMMAHGRLDELVNMKFPKATKNFLQSLNYDVSWYEYPIEHSVCPEEINDISTWFANKVFKRA